MERVTIVLVMLAVASAYPYSPYTDHRGEPKNVKLSEDAVAAYLKGKMEVENLGQAKIMEYVETLLQGKKKGGGTTVAPKDPECLITGSTQYSLTGSKLDMLLNTLSPTTLVTHATILTPDHGKNMFINEIDRPWDAYISMLEQTFGEITNIWANYSPCPRCVSKLLSHYKEGDDKPTIHVARIYAENETLSDIVTSLQCLAKLGKKGFKIVAWNFSEFKAPNGTPVLVDECISAITNAEGVDFTSAMMELDRHVTFIQALGENPHASSWCEQD